MVQRVRRSISHPLGCQNAHQNRQQHPHVIAHLHIQQYIISCMEQPGLLQAASSHSKVGHIESRAWLFREVLYTSCEEGTGCSS